MTTLQRDRYRIDTLLGQGGIGDTFKALDRDTKEWVALKVMALTAAENWKTTGVTQLMWRSVRRGE